MAAVAESSTCPPPPCCRRRRRCRRRDWTNQAADTMAVDKPCEDNEEKEQEEEEVMDCSICMCAVTGEEDEASLDTCTHAFHFACIIKVRAVLVPRARRCIDNYGHTNVYHTNYLRSHIQMRMPHKGA